MITFREAVPTSQEHLDFLNLCHPDWATSRKNRVLEAFKNSAHSFCAFDDDKLVGTSRLITDYTGFGLVADLLVHPEYRRQGIATNLLKMITGHFPNLYIYADAASREISSLYTKAGFKKVNIFRYKKY